METAFRRKKSNSYSYSVKVKEGDNCWVARERWELKYISELCDKEVFVDLTGISVEWLMEV